MCSNQNDRQRIVARVMQIGRQASARPVLDHRTPEEILGYDESGIPR